MQNRWKKLANYTVGEIGRRPWGYWRVNAVGMGFVRKTIVVNPGASLSLQSHRHRSEKWEVVEGIAEVTIDSTIYLLTPSDSAIEIPIGAIHRLKNIGETILTVKETLLGSILDENDITRYEDLYGRSVYP
ncbi:MAG: phosphomannose isomerase type II C-terminal cupin domain [Holosporaceae bacterium]|jgi:mannose-6-phosphate isomerase-like protein (cupin superfamily)|nr:phosphomannose isomerase type II C-terminal cupin domain [Holosporaceae bacterium]